MARLCFNARGDVGNGRGIVINAGDATNKNAAFACCYRSFYGNSRSCGAAKTEGL
jgi:hypothetical protein